MKQIHTHSSVALLFLTLAQIIGLVHADNAHAQLRFGNPVNIGETVNSVANPAGGITIGANNLTMMYAQPLTEGGNDPRIWQTVRDSLTSPWEAPTRVTELTPRDGGTGVLTPFLSNDGRTLLYAQLYPGPGETVWMATRSDATESWSEFTELPSPVNVGENVAVGATTPFLSRDGNTLLIASGRASSGAEDASDIWQFTKNEHSEWENAVMLPEPINSEYRERQPAMSADGLLLFFASDRPGGFGGLDLYVSQRESASDNWGEPMNLGASINTAENDNSPSLSSDGSVLYYRTRGLPGFNENDIWSVSVVPEPSTCVLSLCGAMIAVGFLRGKGVRYR